MNASITIRPLSPNDDMAVLTEVIHAAYAERAAMSLHYLATNQTMEDTASRYQSGHGLVAEIGTQVVGTITVRPPRPASKVPLYRDSGTWTICQFAVLPTFRGLGIGFRLHTAALQHAQANGGHTMALDTAAPATDLIERYLRWGYAVVGECDWRPQTNYPSILMSRPI